MKYLVLAVLVLVGCSAQGDTYYMEKFEIPCSEKVKAMRPGVAMTCISAEAEAEAATDIARDRARIQPGTAEDAMMRGCSEELKWGLDRTEPDYLTVASCYFEAKKKWDSLSNEKKRIVEPRLWASLK